MFIKIVIVCLIAVILNHTWNFLKLFQPSGHNHNHSPGQCRLIPGIERGAEDFNLLKNGLVLVSSGLFEFGLCRVTEEFKPGRLLLFDFNRPHGVEELKLPAIFDKTPLNPHGISVWQDPNSDVVTVFVINHQEPGSGDHVEKLHLDLSTHKLTHIRTIVDDNFVHTNDILALGEDSFYITLDMSFKSDIGKKFEMYFMLHNGAVFHHDGQMTREVVSDLFLPNGIVASQDGKYIYVGIFGKGGIFVFKRDVDTNDLEVMQKYVAYTAVDNLHIDKVGNLWAGCHPHGNQLMPHLVNGSLPSPSQVLRFETQDGLITSMSEVYSDDGRTLSGASAALYHNDKLLIGSVRHKMLLCDVQYLHQ